MHEFESFEAGEINRKDFEAPGRKPVSTVLPAWRPILTFETDANAALNAKNVFHIKDMLLDTANCELHYTSILSAPYHRKLVAYQSGEYGSASIHVSNWHRLPNPDYRAVGEMYNQRSDLDPAKQLQLFTLLMQFTLYEEALQLVGEIKLKRSDAIQNHLFFEIARCIQRINPESEAPYQIFRELNHESVAWPTRILSIIRYVSSILRFDNDLTAAHSVIEDTAQALDPRGQNVPDWLVDLVLSRYYRALALYHVRTKEIDLVEHYMGLAFEYGEQMNVENEPEIVDQHKQENLKILLESIIKLHQMLKSADGVAYVTRLEKLAGHSPHSFLAIGDYYEALDKPVRAADALFKSSLYGGGRAAGAAYRAARLLFDNDNKDAAITALKTSLDLNPSAHIAADCLAALTSNKKPQNW